MILSRSPEFNSASVSKRAAEPESPIDLLSSILGGKAEKPSDPALDAFGMAYLAALQQQPQVQPQEAPLSDQLPILEFNPIEQPQPQAQLQQPLMQKEALSDPMASALDQKNAVRMDLIPPQEMNFQKTESRPTPQSKNESFLGDLAEVIQAPLEAQVAKPIAQPISGHEFLQMRREVEGKKQSLGLMPAKDPQAAQSLVSGSAILLQPVEERASVVNRAAGQKARPVGNPLSSASFEPQLNVVHQNNFSPAPSPVSFHSLESPVSLPQKEFSGESAFTKEQGAERPMSLSIGSHSGPTGAALEFLPRNSAAPSLEIAPQAAPHAGGAPAWPEHEVMQVSQNLKSLAQQGEGEVRIRLRPEHLGELHIRLSAKNGAIDLKIQASSESARKVLEKNLPSLEKSLLEHQLKLEKVEVATASSLNFIPGGDSSPRDPSFNPQWNSSDSGSALTGGFQRGSDSQERSSQPFNEGSPRGAPAPLARAWPGNNASRTVSASGRLDLWA